MNRILTFNSHTGYHYLLSKTGLDFDVVNWNTDERLIPKNFNLIQLDQAIQNIKQNKYDIVLSHKRDDLFFILRNIKRKSKIRIIYVIHGRYQRSGVSGGAFHKIAKAGYRQLLKFLSKLYNLELVFITPAVKVSWELNGFVITPGIDINDFAESSMSLNKLLVVGNNLHRHYFNFDFLKNISKSIPLSVVGYNPYIENCNKAKNFLDLLGYYKTHKAFLYLANEPEEGFNLSLLEAMASGLPVITMFHPTSPIIHNYNGFVAYSENEYMDYCKQLLQDETLAKKLGHNARETVKIYFSINEFVRKWRYVIEK